MIHIERTHTIELPLPPAPASPLFTPPGETQWIEEWQPEFTFPADGETREGMAFKTSHDGEPTIWSCSNWDPDNYSVTYVRITPGRRFGFVDVICRSMATDRSQVGVTYRYTALSHRGDHRSF